MSKHTPGPWEVGCYDARFIFGKDGGLVAEACRGDAAEDFANANLIAATPDLLAACKAAREWLGERPSTDEPYYRAVKNLIDKLDATIAKAEGAQ